MRTKILSLLVLLMVAASSAWAQDHEYVDLGLPSGTLWATCNVGADSPEENGSFFALGEVEPKTTYTRNNYKWGTNPAETSTLTKYCDSDGLNTLLPEDDAATVNWGVQWCMPTRAQVDELIENCNVTTTTLNGKAGYLYTSKINSETIFFPNAGYVDDANGTYYGNDERAYYWTSTAYEEYEPGKKGGWMHYNWNGVEGIKTKPACRGCGMPVRPVFNKDAVPVTTNKAQGETTFTQATFTMPANDATVGFDIVRDMAVSMTTKVGDGADGADYRIRLKKQNNAWELADIELDALKALITVTDGIENVNLACFGQDAVCTLQIFAIDDDDQPTGDAISFANLEPGRYKAKAVAKADGDYIGETGLSNVIVLFQGYEVEVPAKEMITYYKDENLYADQETSADAELYTVSDVSGTTVTLSDAITIVPAYTAMLVYNPTDVTKTFLLIPTEDDADAITPYAGFKGTNEDKAQGATGNGPWRMAANTKYYGCNGNDFVWIKNAGAVAAHRCWIEISTANAPGRLTIVFEKEEATGVNEVSEVNEASDGAWYDLSGRKLDGEPTAKGVYIKDGKKVVVR